MTDSTYSALLVVEYVEKHINLLYEKIPEKALHDFLLTQLSEISLNYFNGQETEVNTTERAIFSGREIPVFFKGDLVGSSFLLLSGFYEFKHNKAARIAAKETILGKIGFNRVPVVNYYLEELISRFTKANLIVPIKRHKQGKLFLSHDIDRINGGWFEGGFDALKKGSFLKVFKGILARVEGKDPWNNLLEIAAFEESQQCTSTFFILTKRDKENSDYELNQPILKHSLRSLIKKGFEIGVHGTKGSHINSKVLTKDCQKLEVQVKGNRFHFLYFCWQNTVRVLEDSGIQYDASLGFYDDVGFRNGFAHPFFLFNHASLRCTEVLEIPLNAMDTTFRKKEYMKLSDKEIEDLCGEMIIEVKKFGGVFSLLWHNNYFSDYKFQRWKSLYIHLLKTYSKDLNSLNGMQLLSKYKPL